MSKSIYATVLGEDFHRLHPKIQERFGFDSQSRRRAIGRGIMDRVWHGKFFTIPFLMLGTWRNIMFPDQGENVPFTIENWAYVDTLGRETVTELRTFRLGRERRFDAYMVRDPVRNQVVDYMGTHQHLAVDLHLSVAENGGLRIESGQQRFYEGPIAFQFPMFFSGQAHVYVWFDESIGRYKVECEVKNKFWGTLFGFVGTFDVDWADVDPADIPKSVMPKREESRL
jgi:hypothetical protein